MTATKPALPRTQVVLRIAAGLLGGYAFVWGLSSFGIAGLVASGVAYQQAQTTLMLLAFLVFLTAFLWAFAAASIARVWAVLGGGGVFMTAAAWGLQRFLV